MCAVGEFWGGCETFMRIYTCIDCLCLRCEQHTAAPLRPCDLFAYHMDPFFDFYGFFFWLMINMPLMIHCDDSQGDLMT